MTSSVTDIVLSTTVPSIYFPTVKNWCKTPVKISASLFREEPWPLRPNSGCATVHTAAIFLLLNVERFPTTLNSPLTFSSCSSRLCSPTVMLSSYGK